jgi:predicted ATPase
MQQIAPWFDDFVIAPLKLNETNVLLNWRERNSDVAFGTHQLSDGTLRAMALITLLLQPEVNLPDLIIIDEPELGLHPYAINVLAALMKQAAHHCQIVIATQSVPLLNEFHAGDVVVVERDARKSTFERLQPEKLKEWLDEYSLGELWEKNVLGGGPA